MIFHLYLETVDLAMATSFNYKQSVCFRYARQVTPLPVVGTSNTLGGVSYNQKSYPGLTSLQFSARTVTFLILH